VRYLHGSHTELDVGLILKGRGSAYEADWGSTDFYGPLERCRPPHMTSHSDAVFMVADVDDIDLAGGATDYQATHLMNPSPR